MRGILRILGSVAVVAALLSTVAGWITSVRAGEDPDALLNYSFAVWVGSGVYKVPSADKRFAVLRTPFSYTLRTGRYEKPNLVDRLGYKLLLPAVFAAEEETDTDFTFGAAAFVPGLEVQIPVNAFWTLKPFGQVGAGKDTAGGDLRYIYGGGIRSLVSFPWEKFVFGIGNSMILAEDRDSTKKESSGFSMLEAGLDIQHPLGISFLNRNVDVGLFFVVSRFFNRVDFLEDSGDTERVNLIYTAGLTVGAKEPVSIWGVDFDRAGIDYRWGDEGFRGLGLNLGFPF